VWITQAESEYPDLAPGAFGTNSRPFQLCIMPGFVCGTDIQLALTVTTADQGTFTVRFTLPSGAAGAAQLQFDNNTPVPLHPDALSAVMSM